MDGSMMRRIDAFGVLGMAAFAVGLGLAVVDANGGMEIAGAPAATVVILLVSGGVLSFISWWVCIQDWKTRQPV